MEFEQSHVAAGDLGEFVAGVEDSLLLSGQAEHVAPPMRATTQRALSGAACRALPSNP